MTYERKTEKGSSLFEHPLNELLNTENPLLVLAEKIDWKFIEKNLSPLYSKRGRPAHTNTPDGRSIDTKKFAKSQR